MKCAERILRCLQLLLAFSLGCPPAFAIPLESSLEKDQKPALIVVVLSDEIMLSRRARPLSPVRAGVLAATLGPIIAMPVIRSRSAQYMNILPEAWRTSQPDRGFAEQLAAALSTSQDAVPWHSVRFAKSGEEIDRLLNGMTGDVAVALFSFELLDASRSVQFSVNAAVTMIHDAGTSQEERMQTQLQHVSTPVHVNRTRAFEFLVEFQPGGRLDQIVAEATRDMSQALAMFITAMPSASAAAAAPGPATPAGTASPR